MGHHLARELAKVRRQQENKRDNERYYQNGSAPKTPRTESQQKRDRAE